MLLFISYRREDSAAETGRIDDKLRQAFGQAAVFRDLENIPIGADFFEHIEGAVGSCSVLVAVIGAHWLTPRLQDPHDFVRLELEAAFKRGVPVVPVLVNGASMPAPEQLPDSLAYLARRHALRVDSGRDFPYHIAGLIDGLARFSDGSASATSSSTPAAVASSSTRAPKRTSQRLGAMVIASAVVLGGIILLLQRALSQREGASFRFAEQSPPATESASQPRERVVAPLPSAWLEPAYDPAVWGRGNFTCLPLPLIDSDVTELRLELASGEIADVQVSLAHAPELCRSPERCKISRGCPALGIGGPVQVDHLAARLSRREISPIATLVYRGAPVAAVDLSLHGSVAQALKGLAASPAK